MAALWLTLFVAVVVVGLSLDVQGNDAELGGLRGPQCLVKESVGVGCPGCGLTRGSACVLQGQYVDALRFNAAAFVVVLIAIAGIPVQTWMLVRGRTSPWHSRAARLSRWLFGLALSSAWLIQIIH